MTLFKLSRLIVKGLAAILLYGLAFGLLVLAVGVVWLGVLSVFSMIF